MDNERPFFALGHVTLNTKEIKATHDFLVKYGMRPIVLRDNMAVLELRGGTHLVLKENALMPESEANFDLMVDNIDQFYEKLKSDGMELTDLQEGKVHKRFKVKGPGGIWFVINSSHVSNQPV